MHSREEVRVRVFNPSVHFEWLYVMVLCLALSMSGNAFAGGTVTNCTEADLRAVLAGGGNVKFGCGGTLSLANTLEIATDTLIDANGYAVTIDGGSSVRLLEVSTNVNLEIRGVTMANGFVVGTNSPDGNAPTAGGDGYGAGILNQGGT